MAAVLILQIGGRGIAHLCSLSSRPSFLDIAQKFGTDKVTTHRYNYSMSYRSVIAIRLRRTLLATDYRTYSVREIPRAHPRQETQDAGDWAGMQYGLWTWRFLSHLAGISTER